MRDTSRLRRRTIGYVFQDFNLLAGLTALENVSLPLELDGVSAAPAQKEAAASLAAMGLDGRGGHFPDQLSGGERQRVAIARAVVGGRHLLLADEPSGALDSANAQAVMAMIRDACHEGVAAVVVTHDAHWPPWPTASCTCSTAASPTRSRARARPDGGGAFSGPPGAPRR